MWLTRWPRPSSATANVRALWHVHRSGESGSPGGGRLDQRIQIAQQRRVEIDRALAAAARPSRPAARERLVRRQFTQTALDGRCRDTRGSGDQRRAAITDRLGLSRRPHAARSLREHGRQRCMLCPQGGQLHGRSVLLADQPYKQLFPYSLLVVEAAGVDPPKSPYFLIL